MLPQLTMFLCRVTPGSQEVMSVERLCGGRPRVWSTRSMWMRNAACSSTQELAGRTSGYAGLRGALWFVSTVGRGPASGLLSATHDGYPQHLHEHAVRLGTGQQILDHPALLDPQEPAEARPVPVWAQVDGGVRGRYDPALEREVDLELGSALPTPNTHARLLWEEDVNLRPYAAWAEKQARGALLMNHDWSQLRHSWTYTS